MLVSAVEFACYETMCRDDRACRGCNFHEAGKDYLERGAFPFFFDAFSLHAARIVNKFIIFGPGNRSILIRKALVSKLNVKSELTNRMPSNEPLRYDRVFRVAVKIG